MSGEDHDLLRPLASGELPDDVRRLDLRQHAAGEAQAETHRPTARHRLFQEVGVRHRERRRRDLRHRVLVAHRAGVRQPVGVGADRADEDRHRPELRRRHGATPADRHSLAVARAIVGPLHALAEIDDPALDSFRRQRRERLEILGGHHLGFDPGLRSSDAAAQRREAQALGKGREDLPFGRAPLPTRHHHRFGSDALETERSERPEAPLDAAREPGGAGKPRSRFARERPRELRGARSGERGALQLRDRRRQLRFRRLVAAPGGGGRRAPPAAARPRTAGRRREGPSQAQFSNASLSSLPLSPGGVQTAES